MSRAPVVLLAVCATVLGLANLYAASLSVDGTVDPGFAAQTTHALVGVLAFVAASRAPLDRLRVHARGVWLVVVGLLVAVLLAGDVAGGARSWLAVGPVRIQPSELVKVALPLALAAELTRPTAGWRRWAGGAVLAALPVALIAAQPDMGAVAIVGLGALGLIWLSGLPRWLVGGGVVTALAATPAAWAVLQPYQRARVLTFLQPGSDPSGAGYQTLQSLYAVASGGWIGRGYGAGTQGRLGFLPEHTTDFILASLAEEHGLLGSLATLVVLFALVWTGLQIADRARDRFTALLAAGLAVQLLAQVAVNVGGVLGLMPLTGVTLPFFSYGGSSLLAVWLTVGLLAAAARRGRRRTLVEPHPHPETAHAPRPADPRALARRL